MSEFLARYQTQAAAWLVVILGYALRAYGVNHTALRGDEAFNVGFSALPVSEILAAMTQSEPNPPLYLLALKGWMQIAGNSELAVRWPSVLSGSLTVALTYRLGCALVGCWTGRAAALLTALSPFLVWYAQDARVYSLLAMLVVAAVWQTWDATWYNRLRHWLAAGVLWWLALFAHYFAALPLALVGTALLLAPQTRIRWRAAGRTALVMGGAYLPWALYVAAFLAGHSKSWIKPPGAGEAVWRFLTIFSVGTPAAGGGHGLQWVGGICLALMLVAGIVLRFQRRVSAAIWMLAIGLGPPLGLYMISLARPVFTEQYAISSLPGSLLIAAAGALALATVKRLGRIGVWLSGAGVIGLVLAALFSLHYYFFDPAYAKSPNWRGVAQYLLETVRQNEVVVLNLPDPAFYHYYRSADGTPRPVEASPPGPFAQVGASATEAQLRHLRDAFHHIRFFFAPSPGYDPEGFVGQWLEACCEKTSDTFVYGFRVQTFDTPAGSLAARLAYPVAFEKGITLTGYRFVNPQVRAGELLHLTLYWLAGAPVDNSYTVFVHLLALDGFYVAGGDSLPRNGAHPTDHWTVGETVIDSHMTAVPSGALPGDYHVQVGLYLLSTGERLTGVDPTGAVVDHVTLPVTVRVESP